MPAFLISSNSSQSASFRIAIHASVAGTPQHRGIVVIRPPWRAPKKGRGRRVGVPAFRPVGLAAPFKNYFLTRRSTISAAVRSPTGLKAADRRFPTLSLTRFSGSSTRCAYLAVVAGFECPSNFPIISSDAPPAALRDAKLWRRSCSRTCSVLPLGSVVGVRFAASRMRTQTRLRPTKRCPSFLPTITKGLPSTRGIEAKTSSAAGLRWTDFDPVFESGRFRKPRSKSIHSQRAFKFRRGGSLSKATAEWRRWRKGLRSSLFRPPGVHRQDASIPLRLESARASVPDNA